MRSHEKILLVDDDPDDQAFFVDVLKEITPGTKCHISENGIEALEYLNTDTIPPSLIFLDLNMPLMDGYQCLTELKKDDRFKAIPVIIFTTSNILNDIQKTKDLGADYFFTKPFDYEVFGQKMREVLRTDFSAAAKSQGK